MPPSERVNEEERKGGGRQAERRRTMESAKTHPNIRERPVGTLPTIDEKPLTTISNGRKTIRSAAGSGVVGRWVEWKKPAIMTH